MSGLGDLLAFDLALCLICSGALGIYILLAGNLALRLISSRLCLFALRVGLSIALRDRNGVG